jgi:hypothetical protein
VKYRRNLITSLIDDNDNTLYDHDSKAKFLWQSFKARLGTTNFSGIQFDLSQHFDEQRALDLSQLIFSPRQRLMKWLKTFHLIKLQVQMASTQIS